jgi:hypothetical protein
MGIDIVAALKAIVALVALILSGLGVYKYGKAKESKGRNDMKGEIEEAIGENYKDLADDVLDGGHPYRVRDSSIAEISSSRPDAPKRMAANVHRNGGDGGSDGSDATTS